MRTFEDFINYKENVDKFINESNNINESVTEIADKIPFRNRDIKAISVFFMDNLNSSFKEMGGSNSKKFLKDAYDELEKFDGLSVQSKFLDFASDIKSFKKLDKKIKRLGLLPFAIILVNNINYDVIKSKEFNKITGLSYDDNDFEYFKNMLKKHIVKEKISVSELADFILNTSNDSEITKYKLYT